jgi:hypothetical protein
MEDIHSYRIVFAFPSLALLTSTAYRPFSTNILLDKSFSANCPYFFRENPVELAVQLEIKPENKCINSVQENGNVVQRIRIKHIQIQGDYLNIPKIGVFQDLSQAIFREAVVMIKILRQRLCPGNWVCPIERMH